MKADEPFRGRWECTRCRTSGSFKSGQLDGELELPMCAEESMHCSITFKQHGRNHPLSGWRCTTCDVPWSQTTVRGVLRGQEAPMCSEEPMFCQLRFSGRLTGDIEHERYFYRCTRCKTETSFAVDYVDSEFHGSWCEEGLMFCTKAAASVVSQQRKPGMKVMTQVFPVCDDCHTPLKVQRNRIGGEAAGSMKDFSQPAFITETALHSQWCQKDEELMFCRGETKVATFAGDIVVRDICADCGLHTRRASFDTNHGLHVHKDLWCAPGDDMLCKHSEEIVIGRPEAPGSSYLIMSRHRACTDCGQPMHLSQKTLDRGAGFSVGGVPFSTSSSTFLLHSPDQWCQTGEQDVFCKRYQNVEVHGIQDTRYTLVCQSCGIPWGFNTQAPGQPTKGDQWCQSGEPNMFCTTIIYVQRPEGGVFFACRDCKAHTFLLGPDHAKYGELRQDQWCDDGGAYERVEGGIREGWVKEMLRAIRLESGEEALQQGSTAAISRVRAVAEAQAIAIIGPEACGVRREGGDIDILVIKKPSYGSGYSVPQASDSFRMSGFNFHLEDARPDGDWLTRDLCIHATGYAVWMKGERPWAVKDIDWDQAFGNKLRRVQSECEVFEKNWAENTQNPEHRTRYLLKIYNEMIRLMYLCERVFIPPVSLLDKVPLIPDEVFVSFPLTVNALIDWSYKTNRPIKVSCKPTKTDIMSGVEE